MGDKVTFGHYRVLQRDDGSLWELGKGAMGVTYKALDTDLQRPVALKVINSDLVADEANRDQFLQEARAAAGLRHSNIASVYQLGKDEGQFFYAMEFIAGQTTESYVARYGPMPVRPALRIAWQVSKALAAAARHRLVHGDIKPANIMIVADSEDGWPFVKLLDFGPVRSALAHDSDGRTRPGVPATAQSSSPQQKEERNTDASSDIYSLGCTLWYLLTGETPFTGSPANDFAQERGSKPPWACRVWNLLRGEEPVSEWPTSDLPRQLGAEPAWEKLKPFPRQICHLLKRMLRKESWQRPASAMQLQCEIEQCLVAVERREALAARIALPLNIGREWLIEGPWTRRAAVFGASAMTLALALAYYWNSDPPQRSARAMQTSGTQDSADSNPSLASEMAGWSNLGAWNESLQSSALADRLSFAEPLAADPAIIGAASWLHAESIWDGAVAAEDDSWSEKEGGQVPAALTSGSAVAVAGGEGKKVAVRKAPVRDKHKVKKTTKRYSYASYAKKPQRRVTSRARDQGFNPLRVVQQARDNIRRVIRKIF
jgi:serine/threonine protein kinase